MAAAAMTAAHICTNVPQGKSAPAVNVSRMQIIGVALEATGTLAAPPTAIKAHEVAKPIPMDWCFWFDANGKAFHTAIVWHPSSLYIGAEGGGSKVLTVDDARKMNAFVKVRPLVSRPGARFVNPWASRV